MHHIPNIQKKFHVQKTHDRAFVHRIQKHIQWTAVRNYSGSVKNKNKKIKKKTQTRLIRKRKTYIGVELARWEIKHARYAKNVVAPCNVPEPPCG